MKTEAIKQSIVSNFRTLSKKAKVAPTQEHVYPAWGLNYKKTFTDGFVSELGIVQRNGAEINIVKGEVQQAKQPFYMTWKRTLKKINTMLKNIDKNLDNDKVVTKQILNIVTFPEKHGK